MNPIIRLAFIFFLLQLHVKIKLHTHMNNHADENIS